MAHKDHRVAEILKWLERRGTKRNREGMARYGIVSPHAFGVSVARIRELGRRVGRDHELALGLWRFMTRRRRMNGSSPRSRSLKTPLPTIGTS